MTSEKRGPERFGTHMSVRVLGTDIMGVTQDFSQTGLSFTSSTAFAVGTRLDLVLGVTHDFEVDSFQCEVEVIWCIASGALFTVGAKLRAVAAVD